MPKQLQSEEDARREWLRPGFALIKNVLSKATEELHITLRNIHFSVSGGDFNAKVYYRRWFRRVKVCEATLFDRHIYLHSKYPCVGVKLSDPPTKGEILALRGHIEDIMFSMKLPVPHRDPLE
jgi:hypothetical protein